MNKEKYTKPLSEEVEFGWASAICQTSSGTESFSIDDDLDFPNDFWN